MYVSFILVISDGLMHHSSLSIILSFFIISGKWICFLSKVVSFTISHSPYIFDSEGRGSSFSPFLFRR